MATKPNVWRDPAFRWTTSIGLVLVVVYLALVGLTWHQESVGAALRWSHGGAAGLQALLTALTALAVVYYLVETRRLRLASQDQLRIMDEARWPLIFPGLSHHPLYEGQKGAVLWAKNVGGGPAVEVHLIGLTSSQPMARAQVSLISVVSQGGVAVSLIEWQYTARQEEIQQDVAKMRIEIRCFEQTKQRKFRWVWQGHRDWPGYFELLTFETSIIESTQ